MNRRNDAKSGKSKSTRRGGKGKPSQKRGPSGGGKKAKPTKLRIIGGDMRGRLIHYHGENFTRPMKDNIRENLFNILGMAIKGSVCFDLFAGTGALALESISRGASNATAIEQSKLAIGIIRKTVDDLKVADKLKILTGDAFRLGPELLGPPNEETPWIVYLCPPYILWTENLEQLNGLILRFMNHAPPGSVLVAETEKSFDHDLLFKGDWDLREYGGTRLGFIQPVMQCGLTYEGDL